MARTRQADTSAGGGSMTTLLQTGAQLGPYVLISQIGVGGMGEVWKAQDTRLGRTVAIKQVKEQHSERFKQEARTIAALNHPYICQLHDIGEDYLVLEYVEGKPLSSPLPEREAVRLAIQIATAIEAAHKKGIIHRDLKPGNIMVTDEGSVKLLDFGLAKLYEQDASISTLATADFPATQAGAVLGTIAYMSPEQAQGQPVDARSDIFSFGLVLYEMLSGKRAFSGDSNYALMNAIVKQDPAPLQTSPALEKIVRQCLAKQPSERYQTISEAKVALEQIPGEKTTGSPSEKQPSIAVLPFVNMSGDKEQEYFSDGLAEEVINALAQISGLKVTARTSAFAFKGKQEDIRRIAEALGVSTILEGSVRKAGNRIRVTAQLIAAADGNHIWSERYDREMTDVFAIQDEISLAITEKLRMRLSGDRPLIRRHVQNPEAFNLYLKGRYHLHRPVDTEGMAKCKKCFEQSIAMDPKYALPWFGLARLYFNMGNIGLISAKAARTQSHQAALKALELDEMLPEAHAMVGALRAAEFDWAGAEPEFRRALELGPELSDVWWQYSFFYLVPLRRLEESFAAQRRALELDPLSPSMHNLLGTQYFLMRQHDRAIEQYRNLLELDPNYHLAHLMLSLNFIQIGKPDEAVREMETATQSIGFIPLVATAQSAVYAAAGRKDEARKVLDELRQFSLKASVPPYCFAMIYSALGEIDQCFDWLEKAVEERDANMLITVASPVSDPLRSHPRWKALMRKMNLEP
jgi:eukaryotic-like serine/threonine-protein kinase